MSDLINRRDAIEEIARRDTTNGTIKVFSGKEVAEILNSLPSAEPDLYAYCPNCGADMRSESVRWAELGESLVAGLEAGLRGKENG